MSMRHAHAALYFVERPWSFGKPQAVLGLRLRLCHTDPHTRQHGSPAKFLGPASSPR